MRQLKLNLNRGRHGGRRTGSGRKRIHSRGVAHRTREKVSSRTPCHVNFKFRCNIKNKFALRLLKRAIVRARLTGLRVIHFSLQSNHVHLIIEPINNDILTKGMRSLTITFAKGLQKGKVQVERYHLHVLRSIKEARNAAFYVLFNKQKHEKGICSTIDEYTSLLGMKDWRKLVKEYAVKNRQTLKIGKHKVWVSDNPHSFILKSIFLT